jgi:hypothetical protein
VGYFSGRFFLQNHLVTLAANKLAGFKLSDGNSCPHSEQGDQMRFFLKKVAKNVAQSILFVTMFTFISATV